MKKMKDKVVMIFKVVKYKFCYLPFKWKSDQTSAIISVSYHQWFSNYPCINIFFYPLYAYTCVLLQKHY